MSWSLLVPLNKQLPITSACTAPCPKQPLVLINQNLPYDNKSDRVLLTVAAQDRRGAGRCM